MGPQPVTMPDDPITTCPTCAAEVRAGDLVRREGELEVYRCPGCGRTIELAVLRQGDLPPQPGSFAVTLAWSETDSAARVATALRRLVPAFADRSIADLRARVAEGTSVELPELDEASAEDLVARARDLGLHAERRLE